MPWFILVSSLPRSRSSTFRRALMVACLHDRLGGGRACQRSSGPVATTAARDRLRPPRPRLTIKPLRRTWLAKPVLDIFRKILPEMSPTERTHRSRHRLVGRPNCSPDARIGTRCSATARPRSRGRTVVPRRRMRATVRSRERLGNHHGVAGPVAETWQYIKERGFLGMIIPKQYGGNSSPLRAFAGHHEALHALLGRRRFGDGAELARPRRTADALRHRTSRRTTICRASHAARKSPALR
jgi:hypothetical protein